MKKQIPTAAATATSFLKEVGYADLWRAGKVTLSAQKMMEALSRALTAEALFDWGRAFVRRKALIVKYNGHFTLPNRPQPRSAATPIWHVEYLDARAQGFCKFLTKDLHQQVAKLPPQALEDWCVSIEAHLGEIPS